MKKNIKSIMLFGLGLAGLVALSCETSQDPIPPRITHLEIGSGDSGAVAAGSDLHVDIEIEAGERIDLVEIRIEQRPGETYSHAWDEQIVYDGHRGARNAHIHEHIDIPNGAAVGAYDFVVSVSDQNGTRAETRRDLTIEAALD